MKANNFGRKGGRRGKVVVLKCWTCMQKGLSSFYFLDKMGHGPHSCNARMVYLGTIWVLAQNVMPQSCFFGRAIFLPLVSRVLPEIYHKSRHPPCIILVLIFLSPTLAQGRGQSIYAWHWHSILSLTEEENHFSADYLFISNNYRHVT